MDRKDEGEDVSEDNYTREELHKLYVKKVEEAEDYMSLILEKDLEISTLNDNNKELQESKKEQEEVFEKRVSALEESLRIEIRRRRNLELKLGRSDQKVSVFQEKMKNIETWSNKIYETAVDQNIGSISGRNNILSPPKPRLLNVAEVSQPPKISPPQTSSTPSKEHRVIRPSRVVHNNNNADTFLFSKPKPKKRKRKTFESQKKKRRETENSEPKAKRNKICSDLSDDSLERPSIGFPKGNERSSEYVQRVLMMFVRKYATPKKSPKKKNDNNNMVDIFRKFFVSHVCSFFEYLQEKENLLPLLNEPVIQINNNNNKFKSFSNGLINGLLEMVRQRNGSRIVLYLDLVYVLIFDFLSSDPKKVFEFLEVCMSQFFSKIITSVMSSSSSRGEVKLNVCGICLLTKFLPHAHPACTKIKEFIYTLSFRFVITLMRSTLHGIRISKNANTFHESYGLVVDLIGFFVGGLGIEFMDTFEQKNRTFFHFLSNILEINRHQFFLYIQNKRKKLVSKKEYLGVMDIVNFHNNEQREEEEPGVLLLSSTEKEVIVVLECYFVFHNVEWVDVFNRFLFGDFFEFVKTSVQGKKYSYVLVWCYLAGSLSKLSLRRIPNMVYVNDKFQEEENGVSRLDYKKKKYCGLEDLFQKLVMFFNSSEKLFGMEAIKYKIVCSNALVSLCAMKNQMVVTSKQFLDFMNEKCIPFCRHKCRADPRIRNWCSEELRYMISKVTVLGQI